MNFMCDFETTTKEQSDQDGRTRVWLYDICDIATCESVDTGKRVSDFLDFFDSLGRGQHKAYFHNLAFDGTFLIHELFALGFTHSREKKLQAKEFGTLISDNGQWYSIKVCFRRQQKNTLTVTFIDSLKKIPFSVSVISKMFGLSVTKSEIDYHKYRGLDYVPTNEEIDYVRRDNRIVAIALSILFANGDNKMTVGSDAMSDYQRRLGEHCEGFFNYHFPTLSLSADDEIRLAYKGGYVYLNPKYKGVTVVDIITYDVNSLYPSTMRYKPMPFGLPLLFKGQYIPNDKYPLYIQRVVVGGVRLRHGHVPTIQIKGNHRFVETEYLSEIDEPVTLTLTNIDLTIMFEHYDIDDIEYQGGYMFRAVKGLFNNYIDYWMDAKKQSEVEGNTPMRTLAKLKLNNLYGKFITNPRKTSKVPHWDGEVVTYKKGDTSIDKPIYSPIGCFVTAYARQICIEAIQANFDNFVYSDTDSIHLTKHAKGVTIDSNELGSWKDEGVAVKALFVKPKTYLKQYGDGHIHCTGASITPEVKKQITFDNFKVGARFYGKRKKKRVKGGTIIYEDYHTIR